MHSPLYISRQQPFDITVTSAVEFSIICLVSELLRDKEE